MLSLSNIHVKVMHMVKYKSTEKINSNRKLTFLKNFLHNKNPEICRLVIVCKRNETTPDHLNSWHLH